MMTTKNKPVIWYSSWLRLWACWREDYIYDDPGWAPTPLEAYKKWKARNE